MRRVRREEGHQPGCVLPDRLPQGIREPPVGAHVLRCPAWTWKRHPVLDERRTDCNGSCHDMHFTCLVRARAKLVTIEDNGTILL